MELPGLVEPPVFGNSEASVPGTLVPGVLPAGAVGCYLHDEVGRLALIEDDIAVAVLLGPRFGIERNERPGNARSAAGAPGSLMMYLSPAAMVVSGLPKC